MSGTPDYIELLLNTSMLHIRSRTITETDSTFLSAYPNALEAILGQNVRLLCIAKTAQRSFLIVERFFHYLWGKAFADLLRKQPYHLLRYSKLSCTQQHL